MAIQLQNLANQLINGTKEGTITWFEASSRSGFVTVTAKGSIKLAKNDIIKQYKLRIPDNNGVVLADHSITRQEDSVESFGELYDLIKQQLYGADQKIDEILAELGKQPTFVDIETVFVGKWRNNYKYQRSE